MSEKLTEVTIMEDSKDLKIDELRKDKLILSNSIIVLEEQNKKLVEWANGFLGCPRLEDSATKTKNFDIKNESHTEQLVYSVSCSFSRILNLMEILKEGKA